MSEVIDWVDHTAPEVPLYGVPTLEQRCSFYKLGGYTEYDGENTSWEEKTVFVLEKDEQRVVEEHQGKIEAAGEGVKIQGKVITCRRDSSSDVETALQRLGLTRD